MDRGTKSTYIADSRYEKISDKVQNWVSGGREGASNAKVSRPFSVSEMWKTRRNCNAHSYMQRFASYRPMDEIDGQA